MYMLRRRVCVLSDRTKVTWLITADRPQFISSSSSSGDVIDQSYHRYQRKHAGAGTPIILFIFHTTEIFILILTALGFCVFVIFVSI